MYNASFDLLNINLQNKFNFKKRFLGEHALLTFFDETPMALRRKYQEACLDKDLNIITAESHFNIPEQELPNSNSEHQFELKLLTQLDRQIRLIRLVCDCTLHFSEFRYTLTSSKDVRTVGTIPHIDRVIKKTNLPFSINNQQYELIQNCFTTLYPFTNDWVYKVYDFFDSSFLLDDEKALIMLITAFEMVFLKRDRYNKKEILAKRSAVYFGNSDAEILEIYKEMKLCYSARSNYVHEGKSTQDPDSKIHFLRNLLRKFILKNKNTDVEKSDLIQQLKTKVETCPLFPQRTYLEEPPINTNPCPEGRFWLWWHHLFAKPKQHTELNDLRTFYWKVNLGDNLTVDVYVDEWSYVRPHFHLIGRNFHSILRLDKPEYYDHGYSIDILNKIQIIKLYEWIYAHYKKTPDNAWNTMVAHWNFSKNTYYKVKHGLFPNYLELIPNN